MGPTADAPRPRVSSRAGASEWRDESIVPRDRPGTRSFRRREGAAAGARGRGECGAVPTRDRGRCALPTSAHPVDPECGRRRVAALLRHAVRRWRVAAAAHDARGSSSGGRRLSPPRRDRRRAGVRTRTRRHPPRREAGQHHDRRRPCTARRLRRGPGGRRGVDRLEDHRSRPLRRHDAVYGARAIRRVVRRRRTRRRVLARCRHLRSAHRTTAPGGRSQSASVAVADEDDRRVALGSSS